MIKTFQVLVCSDHSWTGGGFHKNENTLNEIDELINSFSSENKIEIQKVDYCMTCSDDIPNTDRDTFLFATVFFTRPD